ncbi:MAG TPA: dGTP triphosphohydrolase, partial [Caldithrix abyssi]|nr:dGTP triphosphohydrolase [Caldithrix abyssi]
MNKETLLQKIAEEKNRQEEQNLSPFATPNSAAVRSREENIV